MAERNTRPGAIMTGITPQVHGDVLADKLNREAAAQIADLQKKVAPPEPGPGEAPSSADRRYLRTMGSGWPFATAALTVASGDPDTVIPGSGFPLGPLYVGEFLSVDLYLWGITNTGVGYTSTELWGSRGQGSALALIEKRTPYFAGANSTPHAWFATHAFIVGQALEQAEIRFKIGSGGGTIVLANGSSTLQRAYVFTPITRAAE